MSEQNAEKGAGCDCLARLVAALRKEADFWMRAPAAQGSSSPGFQHPPLLLRLADALAETTVSPPASTEVPQ